MFQSYSNFCVSTIPSKFQLYFFRPGSIAWPVRSPDLNPLDFYLWDHLKTIVYSTPIASVEEELRARIGQAFQHIQNTLFIFEKVQNSLIRRLQACIQTDRIIITLKQDQIRHMFM